MNTENNKESLGKVVVFNAPPLAGKDVAAAHITKVLNQKGINSYHKEVKENLFKAVKSSYGISEEDWEVMYQRENKESPNPNIIIGGKPRSPRYAMIHMSEKVLKPLFGKDVFGIMAAKSLEKAVNIFSDGGFVEEVKCLQDEVGDDNFLLIHVHRDGCTFEGDSRDYVKGVKGIVEIYNDSSEQEYLSKCTEVVEKFLEGGSV